MKKNIDGVIVIKLTPNFELSLDHIKEPLLDLDYLICGGVQLTFQKHCHNIFAPASCSSGSNKMKTAIDEVISRYQYVLNYAAMNKMLSALIARQHMLYSYEWMTESKQNENVVRNLSFGPTVMSIRYIIFGQLEAEAINFGDIICTCCN